MNRIVTGKLMPIVMSLNALAMLFLAMAIFTKADFMPAAWAQLPLQQQMPDSIPGRYVIAPSQFAPNLWGCYVFDSANMTLAVYIYNPADRMLRLQAVRKIEQDLALTSFNTEPLPADITRLVEKERELKSDVGGTE